MRENAREIFSLPEFTNTKLASARPSKYSSSWVEARVWVMLKIGAPIRGTNSFLPECNCQMTKTDSSPPLSRYAPLGVNAKADTAWECQWSVVVGARFSTAATCAVTLSSRQYHRRMLPFASPVAKYSSAGWKARHVRASGETNLVNPAFKFEVVAT